MTQTYILTMSRNTDYRDADGEWIYEEETYECDNLEDALSFAFSYRSLSSVKNAFTVENTENGETISYE